MGRVSTFSDPEVIRMTLNDFIPVCTDDWYTRRRNDAEGKFFRAVADQGPRKGENGGTRQGIYVFTADGQLLGFKNAGQDAKVMKGVFRDSLAKFQRLPERSRKPGAVEVGDPGKPDVFYVRTIPENGLVLRAHARILDKKDDKLCVGDCEFLGGNRASRDFVWLRDKEIRDLVPNTTEIGFQYPMPTKIALRLARFHCLDNTRGEPDIWTKDQIRVNDMTLTVTEVTDGKLTIRLDGQVTLATEANLDEAKRGYEAKLRGELQYNRQTKTWSKFDIAVLGEHWGRSTYTPGDRPGKSLLGIVLTLADTSKASQRIPPQGIREQANYYDIGNGD